MDEETPLTSPETMRNSLTRRQFAVISGGAVLGSLLGRPERLAALPPGLNGREHEPVTIKRAPKSFDLRITVSGLCLFVPDPRDGRMHVLMPATGPHAHGIGRNIEPHVVRLAYDVAHQYPDSTGPEHEIVYVPVDNGALELLNLSTRSSLDLALPADVVDLDPIVREKVKRERLGPDTGGRVRARMSVASGGVSGWDKGVRWRLGTEEPQLMAISVDWTIPGVQLERLELQSVGLNGHATRPLQTLHPIDGAIHLTLYHSPHHEIRPFRMSPDLVRGAPAEHFAAFYHLFDNPRATPVPRFEDALAEHASWTASYASMAGLQTPQSRLRGVDYTCVAARAELED